MPRVVAVPLVLILWGMFAAPPEALSQEAGERTAGGMGLFQVGYLRTDVDDLNASLGGAGYPSLNESFLTLGGVGYGAHGRFLIGGEGGAVLGSSVTTSDGATRISATGGYGLFRLGYSVVSRSGLDIFPALGIGGGGMELGFAERSAPTFDDVLSDPKTGASLTTGMFLLDASVALTYRINLVRSGQGEARGFVIGLHAGYMFSPGTSSWRLDDINDVAGAPNFEAEGLHLGLSIGGWSAGG